MDGSSFCVAGKRAFHILSTNSLRVFAINSIGDFVLLLGKVFVVLATVLIGIELIQVTKMEKQIQPHNCSYISRTSLASTTPRFPWSSAAFSPFWFVIAFWPFTKWPSTRFSSASVRTASATMEFLGLTTCREAWWSSCRTRNSRWKSSRSVARKTPGRATEICRLWRKARVVGVEPISFNVETHPTET